MATLADNLTRAEALQRKAQFSQLSYAIKLVLGNDPNAANFLSTTTVDFTVQSSVPSFLDLTAASVQRITVNGEDVDLAAFTGSRVELTTLKAGRNRVEIVASCAYQHTGVGLHRIVDPVDASIYVYTHFEPFDAHKVFACFDQPDLKAEMTVEVSAPSAWTVVSNYPDQNQDQSGAGGDAITVHHFGTTPLISPYLVALVAGPLHVVRSEHRGIPLAIYCRKSLAEYLDPDEIFEVTRSGLDFFAEYFAQPYPFAKYDQLMVPEFNMGAMENPGCVTFNEAFVFRSKVTESLRARRANTILHEMAHMWFGDLVTMQWWDDLWLNESFATYMAHLASFEATRFSSTWVDFASTIKTWALRQDQLPSTHPIAADMPDTESVRLNFDGITYGKGASVLRQLVAWVGDIAFRDGLRSYFQRHAWGNAELGDFLHCLEAASGRDLRDWSRDWLETSGVNTLRTHLDIADGVYTGVSINQTAPPGRRTLRSHRVGLGLYDNIDGHLRRRKRVDLDLTGSRVDVPDVTGERRADLVVVNDGDLTFCKIRLDADSIRTLVSAQHGIEDQLTRAVCSAALWDMTRDGEIRTRDYVAIVTHQAPGETDITGLERLIGQALAAIDIYGTRDNRAAARALMAATASQQFLAAAPGSDVQLAWARCLIAASDDEANLERIATWLDRDQVDGLLVDTDLRWQIVVRLCSQGRLSAAAIDAETERDPSDIGQRRAEAALAAQPLASAKAETWQRLTESRGLPLQVLNSLMGGFSQPSQDDLMVGYISRYFEALPGFWAERSADEASSLTEGLFPSYLVSDEVIAGADAALADDRLGAVPRRIISEARDGILRAQRARAVDAGPAPA